MKEEIDLKAFGNRLKELRKHLHLNQKEFAERIGMKNNYLSSIEGGNIMPGIDFLYNITREFRVNPYFLFHNEPPIIFEGISPQRFEEKDFGEANKRVHELIGYIERSPMLKFDMLGYLSRYLIQNRDLIEEDIKNNAPPPGEEEE